MPGLVIGSRWPKSSPPSGAEASTPPISPRGRAGRALQTELDPLLRRVARKRLIRTAAMRRRDRLILAVLGFHTRRDLLTGVRTDIDWAPALAPHLAPPDAASA